MRVEDFKKYLFDIDGTILNTKEEISAKTKDSIRILIDKGIEVLLATGRSLQETLQVAEELEFSLLLRLIVLTWYIKGKKSVKITLNNFY
ncbi:HAD family hydrolase [Peribacillus sp. NPDC097264]|uniref:HAD family hydrolase n=1 Tax=Peribacillus sp. NPDC097264 TaxID=3390616 RepID=UPI003CFE675C